MQGHEEQGHDGAAGAADDLFRDEAEGGDDEDPMDDDFEGFFHQGWNGEQDTPKSHGRRRPRGRSSSVYPACRRAMKLIFMTCRTFRTGTGAQYVSRQRPKRIRTGGRRTATAKRMVSP